MARALSRFAAAGFCACLLLMSARLVVAQSTDGAPAPPAVTIEDLRAFVDPLVAEQLQRRRIAGAVVSVVKDGALVFVNGYGDADVASRRAMAADTVVRVGSITKTLTALAVMQLVERGSLDLDRDVNLYIDFRVPTLEGGAPITLRRLLSHRTGFEDRRGAIGAVSGPRVRLGPFLASHLPPHLGQSADIVAYSNSNAALSAYIVERASGQPLEQYLDEHVFGPLDMVDTTAVQPVPESLRLRVSNGYVRADMPPTLVSMAASTIYEVGSTGVSTTAVDMGRLLIAMLDGDHGIVSRASLAAMMAPQAPLARGFFGLGVYSPVGAGGNAFIGHDGGTGGFHSTLALLPSERFGVFASYNSEGTSAGGLTSAEAELVRQVASRYFAQATLRSHDALPADVRGSYQSSRRVDSNLFTLRALFDQLAVRAADAGRLSLGRGYLPIQSVVLDRIDSNLFRRSGLDVSFGTVGATATMQLGTAVYVGVPWWTSARMVVPAVVACVVLAVSSVLAWPIAVVRARRREVAPLARRAHLLTRVAFGLYVAAIGVGFWMVFWGWPNVALSAPVVPPLSLSLYACAWSGVILTAVVAWDTARLVHQGRGSVRARGRQIVQTGALVALAAFCLYWRIAGTTLSF